MRTFSFLLLVCAATSFGQSLHGVFNPSIPLAGTTVQVRMTNGSTQPAVLSSGCGYNAVISGSPTGPIAFQPFICPLILITIAPCGSRTLNLNLPVGLAPGPYYVRVDYSLGGTGPLIQEFMPFEIGGGTAPVLSSTSLPQLGTTWQAGINAPSLPSALYFTAASFSANVGIPLPPSNFIALDFDLLFQLSFPTPDPLLFQNFQGVLDASGQSPLPIGVNIPNAPALLWQGIILQAALLDFLGNVSTTNPLAIVFTT